jgi:hypothetical protein
MHSERTWGGVYNRHFSNEHDFENHDKPTDGIGQRCCRSGQRYDAAAAKENARTYDIAKSHNNQTVPVEAQRFFTLYTAGILRVCRAGFAFVFFSIVFDIYTPLYRYSVNISKGI